MLKIFILLTPFAILSLVLESTSWFFKAWSKNLFSLREAFIMPSKEKMSSEESVLKLEFSSEINSEKQILLWNKSSPILLIAKEIFRNYI